MTAAQIITELLEALRAVVFDLECTHQWQVENGRIDPVLIPQREADLAKARLAINNATQHSTKQPASGPSPLPLDVAV